MNKSEIFTKKTSATIIGAWLLYGMGSSMILNLFFPFFLNGPWHEAIYLAVFMLLGVLDFVASSISYKKQRSVKLI